MVPLFDCVISRRGGPTLRSCLLIRPPHRPPIPTVGSRLTNLQGLWMCLTCGHIGCSRQQWHGDHENIASEGHALRHYEEQGHAHAQNLQTQRVWDYSQGTQRGNCCRASR